MIAISWRNAAEKSFLYGWAGFSAGALVEGFLQAAMIKVQDMVLMMGGTAFYHKPHNIVEEIFVMAAIFAILGASAGLLAGIYEEEFKEKSGEQQ